MPDKPFTVITYAASASLAAIALIYFFNPNQFIDGDSPMSSARTRKKGIVGLSNPANDCFINSILQSLAGLGDLRLYLIRESHRRELDGPAIYAAVPEKDANGKPMDVRKLTSLQSGEVTRGLKDMIDNLNERPIYKKTISAGAFIQVLEHAFGTRISKSQQDAQELLQIVAERLAEEYHAGRAAWRRARQRIVTKSTNFENTPLRLSGVEERDTDSMGVALESDAPSSSGSSRAKSMDIVEDEEEDHEEEGFSLEGQTEAQIECQYCHFMPKANPTSFVMLNLMVPQKSTTTLNECFDAHFKLEYIDDYKCDKCRLQHAIDSFALKLARAKSKEHRISIENTIDAINKAMENDPEIPPKDIELPDISLAPKRKIARHVQITAFPRVLVIHLSRSIFHVHNRSTKNTSKVSFPERLPLGSILNRRYYKLLGMVSHRGTHNSGHYESFRRQNVYAPFSNPHVHTSDGPYSVPTDNIPSSPASPKLPSEPKMSSFLHPDDLINNSSPNPVQDEFQSLSTASPTHSLISISLSPPSTRPSSRSVSGTTPPNSTVSSDPSPAVGPTLSSTVTSVPPTPSSLSKKLARNPPSSKEQKARPASSSSSSKPAHHPTSLGSTVIKPNPSAAHHRPRFQRRSRKLQTHDCWWRISDDKVKECKTADVLAMQKDVYMLFYEMEREDGEDR